MFTMLVKRRGARVAATDTIAERLRVAARCGAEFTWDPRTMDVASEVKRLTGGRGADLVIVAVSAPRHRRPGDGLLASRLADPAFCPNFGYGTHRSLGGGHLRR